MKGKYIIVSKDGSDFPTAVIIPFPMSHKEMVAIIGGKVISAGFFGFYIKENSIHLECYGDSVSLGVKANPKQDEYYLMRNFKHL